MPEEWIQSTVSTLGNLIQKPKITEKYLLKPPFRYLHDIFLEVISVTKFGEGLFSGKELDSAEVKDKNDKMEILSKMISLVIFSLDIKDFSISTTKIVAGLEPEKTNAFLVLLHRAATTSLDKSRSSVQRVLSGERFDCSSNDPLPVPRPQSNVCSIFLL